jgi:hypothetical protein
MQLLLSFPNLSSNADLLIRKRDSPGFNHFAIRPWRNLAKLTGGLIGSTAQAQSLPAKPPANFARLRHPAKLDGEMV